VAAAAFFDLDRTVLARSSALALAGTFRRRGLISRRQASVAALRQVRFTVRGADEEQGERLIAAGARFLRGRRPEELRALVHEAYPTALRPFLHAEAVTLADRHRAAGEPTFLVSASLLEVVDQIALELGFTGALGTVCAVEDGVYTGETLTVCHGAGKANAVRRLAAEHDLELAASTAYSDSSSDVPLLELVGRPVAVNPDRRLRAVAAARRWEILEFRRPGRREAAWAVRRARA
jgi:HAD superfamily hydrolase (TIGR01490 family)